MTIVFSTVDYEKGRPGYELTSGRKFCYVESLSNVTGTRVFEKWQYLLSAIEEIKSALVIEDRMGNYFQFTNFLGKKISAGTVIN